MINIWHDINPARISPEEFVAVIEIPKGGKQKYELDKETGMLRLDRILYTSMQYPANYGFIPRTITDDNDPLDVLVLCSEELQPMCLVKCYPIGIFTMTDDEKLDEKIIAIPFEDPQMNQWREIDDLPRHIYLEIEHFFTVYKTLEHKETSLQGRENSATARKVINKCLAMYQERFGRDKT